MQAKSDRNNGSRDPIVTVDAVVFTLDQGNLKVLVHKRPREPEMGKTALIGGWIHTNEDNDLEDTVSRVLSEKAGLQDVYVEQVKTQGDMHRHPEGWSLSVVYMAILPLERLKPAFDRDCFLVSADDPGALAFDHNRLLESTVARLRAKGAYSTIPMEFLPEEFSMPELLSTYQAVMGERLDEGSFRRKIVQLGLIESTGRKDKPRDGQGGQRTATMYRAAQKRTFDRSFRR
jgi:ADP-ribose pyrophosphatase YjhB (NUDIX family)